MTVAWIALASSVIDGIVASTWVIVAARRRAERRTPAQAQALTFDDVIRALLIAAALCFAKVLWAGQVVAINGFGYIHFAYLEIVIGAPLAALVVVVIRLGPRGRRVRWTRPVGVVLVGALLLAPLGAYMTFVEPFRLEVETIDGVGVGEARAGSKPIRIGVLADFQLRRIGDYERGAVDRLLAARPDIILLPGDIFQDDDESFQRELPLIKEQFSRMNVPGGAFVVQGDTDPVDRLRTMTEGTPVRVLFNEIVSTRVQDRVITIGGVELDWTSPEAARVANELESNAGLDDIRILLTHRPDSVYNLPTGTPRTDLVVAGHTHGGQIALPWFGPLMTLSSVPRHVGAGGLNSMDGRRIYVGRGVGLERGQAPQMRLLVPPNIGVLTLTD